MTPAFALVLHLHLPFVPNHQDAPCAEEGWLASAAADAWLPLIAILDRLEAEGVHAPFTLAVSPSALAMLEREDHRDLIEDHLHARIDRLRHDARYAEHGHLAELWTWEADQLAGRVGTLRRWGRDLVAALAHHARAGRVELIPSAGAHGLLPLMATHALRVANVRAALALFERRFEHRPAGVWLPECAWDEATDHALAEAGVRYTVVAADAIRFADPRPVLGAYAPLQTPRGVTCFGAESSEVLDAGLLNIFSDNTLLERRGDPLAPLPLVAGGAGLDRSPGLSATDEPRRLYRPAAAAAAAHQHALRYTQTCADEANQAVRCNAALWDDAGRPPLLVSAHRAELFGATWAEGPAFLEQQLRLLAASSSLQPLTLTSALNAWPRCQVAEPSTSSWARAGMFQPWLDGPSHWIYRHLHHLEQQVVQSVSSHRAAQQHRGGSLQGRHARALSAALHQLMLAQTGEWAWQMTQGTSLRYADARVREHLANASLLLAHVRDNALDLNLLQRVEERFSVFQGVGLDVLP